jgi:hypothetical protein
MKSKHMLLAGMLLCVFSITASAQTASISGTITDGSNPLAGVLMRLDGTQGRIVISNASGQYSFPSCPLLGLYVVTPFLANYTFSPTQRVISPLLTDMPNENFTGTLGTLTSSPLDTPEFFVRQQYVDLLKREPDESGLNFWSTDLRACTTQACRNEKRRNLMCGFIASGEYQSRFTGTSTTICQ